MKAKDYAERYKSDPTDAELVSVALDMLAEIKTMVTARHAKYDSALYPIINEINDKWHVFVRLSGISEIYHDGFENILRLKIPEVHQAWILWKKSPYAVYRR